MEMAAKLHFVDLRSAFIPSLSALLDARKSSLSPPLPSPFPTIKASNFTTNSIKSSRPSYLLSSRVKLSQISSKLSAMAVETSEPDAETSVQNRDDIESLFSKDSVDPFDQRRGNKQSNSGASSVSSGVRLENISKGYKGVTVLKNVSWEVKKGEKVGLVGVNGAGKTTQLRIIAGLEEPDSGNVIKAKENMKVAFLSQEFEVSLSRTVKEEFMSAFKEEMEVSEKLEKVQKAIEGSVNDLELMGRLLDEFDLLQKRAQAVDLDLVDAKINKLMPELGFTPEDFDRLVASFSSGWQMRMSLGKILLQVYCCPYAIVHINGFEVVLVMCLLIVFVCSCTGV